MLNKLATAAAVVLFLQTALGEDLFAQARPAVAGEGIGIVADPGAPQAMGFWMITACALLVMVERVLAFVVRWIKPHPPVADQIAASEHKVTDQIESLKKFVEAKHGKVSDELGELNQGMQDLKVEFLQERVEVRQAIGKLNERTGK